MKNSREFVDFIRSERLTSEETMISFDVVSLFTRVPSDLAVQVAYRRLENDASLPKHTRLSVDDIIDIIDLCLVPPFCLLGKGVQAGARSHNSVPSVIFTVSVFCTAIH